MTKTLNHIFFFLHQNQNIFSATLGIRIFFLEKKHSPPSFPSAKALKLSRRKKKIWFRVFDI
jgi:hypothetical protein